MAYFAVTRLHTWERTLGLEEQPLWDEHAAFMDDLVAEGRIVVPWEIRLGRDVLSRTSSAQRS